MASKRTKSVGSVSKMTQTESYGRTVSLLDYSDNGDRKCHIQQTVTVRVLSIDQ